MSERLVIVGAGQAGLQAAASARQEGFAGDVVLIGAETAPPYQRPPLSKAYLKGDLDIARLHLKPAAFFKQANIELRLGTRIEAIDRKRGIVKDAGGAETAYDRLIIATGAPPRRLDCPGAETQGVHYLRTLADSDDLRSILTADGTIVVIGAGYIGLEVAAVARSAGRNVVVIELADRCLKRVAGPAISDYFANLHRAHGVDLQLGAGLEFVESCNGRVSAVRLNDGRTVPCVAVVVGIGAAPDQGLAAEAGLSCDNGVLVDETARTEDARIWAAGDVANFPSPFYKRRLRLESVPNAIDQGKVAGINAARAANGVEPATYDALPWFWSDQYEAKLQTAGARPSGDAPGLAEIIRPAADGRGLSVWTMLDGALQSVDAVNDPTAFIVGKRLIPSGKPVDPGRLGDASQDLKSFL
ncbi:MAG: pyridine nucleotide-disulfide oxidoreductase [Alphaproteobacteria bacterium]|nr:pyridine nucleotide-disulfide oxidoreductase [Alphaproteobacteria bacterium]